MWIRKVYLLALLTYDLVIETPEVVNIDGVALSKQEADDLYKSTYQSVFGTTN